MQKLFFALAVLALGCNSSTQQTQTESQLEWVENWPALPPNYKLSQVTGVGVNSTGNVLLFHRTGREWSEPFPDSTISVPTILTLDKSSGAIVNMIGDSLFIMPHGLNVDKDDNIWVTDVALHQVFKLSPDGQVLMTLGERGKPGTDSTHFNLPTDVAVAADGSFYVSDGYGNSRVVKFSPKGHYLFEWGTKGKQPGQFQTPHGIDIDANGNVYVADRENNRIQKFDANGKFIVQWQNSQAEQLYSVSVSQQTHEVFGIDYLTRMKIDPVGSDILHFDSTLHSPQRTGRSGNYKGTTCRYHDVEVDKDGNVYLGDILGNRIQKFRRR